MTRTAALACLLSTVLIAACGGSAGSGEADPATLAPADAPVYGEAVVRPEGDLREDVLATFGKVSGATDPAAEIRRLLDEATDGKVDYDADIAPWLGERIGVWATNLASPEPGFAVIVASKDTERAMTTIEEAAAEEGEELTERSYEGADYLYSSEEGQAAAAIEDFLVIATEAELKRTIDVADGDSLAERDSYDEALDDLPTERLAHFYVDQRSLFAAASSGQGAADAQILNSLIDPDELEPVAGALVADGERIALDTVGSTAGVALADLGSLSSEAAELLGELPGDAWGAFGIPELGQTAERLFKTFTGAFGGAAIEQSFREETGLDLSEDVFGWIGDVAVYATGVGEDGLRGAVVIEVTDSDRAANAFGKIAGLLQAEGDVSVAPIAVAGAESAFEIRDPELPQPVVLARGSERVVVAYGREAAADALSPGAKLSDADLWSRATDALGGEFEPAFVLDTAAVLENIEAFGGGSDPDLRKARRYFEAIDVITAGGESSGDEQRARIAAALR